MADKAIAGTLTGCVGCMLQIEMLSKSSPGCVNLMTFSTFLFISFVGLVQQSKFFTVIPRNRVPLRKYIFIVLLFFLVNVGNNLSLNFDVSVPVFIMFRSGTLIANLLLGWLLRNRVYSHGKIFSIFLVTFGIITFLVADRKERQPEINTAYFPHLKNIELPFPPLLVGMSNRLCFR
ncbi:unnamed protein product, partial [Enterobius vermicularis]|uniref:EamA domain-containing protein n=1 Tax=Enterobius vermicularis TaxID=51028 RepID=A0A0N4VLV8_ENTVE